VDSNNIYCNAFPLYRGFKEVLNQLTDIGGGRSMDFDANRVRSLPDGIAHALDEYLKDIECLETEDGNGNGKGNGGNGTPEKNPTDPWLVIGDLCPECGHAAMANEEGCHKCYACGYSEC
jgi:ribonucleoside-diphosphate reductase alpha chain